MPARGDARGSMSRDGVRGHHAVAHPSEDRHRSRAVAGRQRDGRARRRSRVGGPSPRQRHVGDPGRWGRAGFEFRRHGRHRVARGSRSRRRPRGPRGVRLHLARGQPPRDLPQWRRDPLLRPLVRAPPVARRARGRRGGDGRDRLGRPRRPAPTAAYARRGSGSSCTARGSRPAASRPIEARPEPSGSPPATVPHAGSRSRARPPPTSRRGSPSSPRRAAVLVGTRAPR